ncbi:MAG: hypothetical protein LBP92_12875 [Deltaproteobacteria bacterium]|nr:hypothetical protein [Deltaproteobacteria bacterium]
MAISRALFFFISPLSPKGLLKRNARSRIIHGFLDLGPETGIVLVLRKIETDWHIAFIRNRNLGQQEVVGIGNCRASIVQAGGGYVFCFIVKWTWNKEGL